MADNTNLGAAKTAKNDEFYTQYSDIEAEMNAYVEYDPDVFRGKTILLPCDDPEWSNFTKYFAANFDRFGLRKLISTSYAKGASNRQLSLFEQQSPLYDEDLHKAHGKLFILERDVDGDGVVDSDDIEFTGYLEGDGDFRSAEVCALRDEADIIITNPPFSLFQDFVRWIVVAEKQFVIIGNQNSVSHKDIFPLIQDGKLWLGAPFPGGNAYFDVPDGADVTCYAKGVYNPTTKQVHFRNCRWFTNMDFARRHEELQLMTIAQNLKFNKKLIKKLAEKYGTSEYPHYANYDALEVPFVEAIPSDYDGIMGVPRTFLDVHNPDQFEIVGRDGDLAWAERSGTFFTPPAQEAQQVYKRNDRTWRVQNSYVLKDGVPETIYARIFIRRKREADA